MFNQQQRTLKASKNLFPSSPFALDSRLSDVSLRLFHQINRQNNMSSLPQHPLFA